MNNDTNSFSSITTPLYSTLVIVICLISLWLYFSPISSAVLASGSITTQRPTQEISSFQTGYISEYFVEDYQYVKKGDVLLILTDNNLNLEKSKTTNNYIKKLIKYINLKKVLQIDLTQSEITEYNKLDKKTVEFEYNQYFSLFLENKEKRDLDEKNKKESSQIIQESILIILSNKLNLLKQELSLIEKEQLSNKTLYEQNLISDTSLSDLERESISIKKQITNTLSDIKAGNLTLSTINNNYEDYINNTNNALLLELDNTYNILNDLTYQKNKIDVELGKMRLLSPVNGFIVNTSNTGEGSFISAQQPLFEIIPESKLIAKVFVNNNDIEDIKVGQMAEVTISAYNIRTTEPIKATITKIATTTMKMDDTLTAYPVELSFQNIPSHINLKTGMPVQVTILKEKRTVIDYLFSIVKHSVGQSMRE